MGLQHYILDEHHRVQRIDDFLEWARWWEQPGNRAVAQTKFECGVMVSTIFLGIDHRHFGKGPPVLFETVVFEMTMDGDSEQRRYTSWDDAETGHKAAVRRVKAQLEKAGVSAVEVTEPAEPMP
jgi:hypothetical protein